MQLKAVGSPAVLYWCARERTGLYLHDWPQAANAAMPLRYVPVLSEKTDDGWRGRSGLAHDAVMADQPGASGYA